MANGEKGEWDREIGRRRGHAPSHIALSCSGVLVDVGAGGAGAMGGAWVRADRVLLPSPPPSPSVSHPPASSSPEEEDGGKRGRGASRVVVRGREEDGAPVERRDARELARACLEEVGKEMGVPPA